MTRRKIARRMGTIRRIERQEVMPMCIYRTHSLDVDTHEQAYGVVHVEIVAHM